jgi:hypothetical protein
MEITFHDPSQMPLPPEETRIQAVRAEPWPDGRRVNVEVQITPFQQRPNLHISVFDDQGQEVVSVGAMQVRQTQLEYTLHLRQPETAGSYKVAAHIDYPELDLPAQARAETTFEIPQNAPGGV